MHHFLHIIFWLYLFFCKGIATLKMSAYTFPLYTFPFLHPGSGLLSQHKVEIKVVLILSSFIEILTLILFIRTRNKLKLNQFRESVAKDLHDDFGSTLTTIRIYNTILKAEADTSNRNYILFDKVNDDCLKLMVSLQEIIWAIQEKKSSIHDLGAKMRESALKVLEASNIKFDLEIIGFEKKIILALQFKRNLFLIFKEAINNALKYADCTEIKVALIRKKKKLLLLIEDNGKGIPEAYKTGNGLLNMKKRAEDIGGDFFMCSKDGLGTKIEIIAKL